MSDTRKDHEELEIDIIQEAWNTYDLEDGSRLRARAVLTKLLWPKGAEVREGEPVEMSLGAKFQNIIVVFDAPAKLRGQPDQSPPSVRETAKMKKEEVGVVDSKEDWNYYRISKSPGGLKLKLVVTGVFRVTGVHDQDGNPYYIVNSQSVLGLMTPREIPSA